jgi:hypothetical protein
MEALMHYKTIVLGLLEDRPLLRSELQRQRRMLATVEQHAEELKASHRTWQDQLAQLRPGSDAAQIASEAMELALAELQERLPSESEVGEGTFSRDEAMARVKRRSPDG